MTNTFLRNDATFAAVGSGDVSGVLVASNNLSDVANAATSLNNLGGLSTSAGLAKSNNLSDVANAATALSNLGGLANPGAWTSYTPAITAASGTFTTVSATGRWVQLGKTVHVALTITITTNGSAATAILATLPATAQTAASGVGRETAIDGIAVVGSIAASSTQLQIVKYDGTFPGASGRVFFISATYEST